jgi:hypothetical protein
MKKIFYEKVGKRYKPVMEYDDFLLDAFPKGSHLVCVYPGGQSTRYKIDPAYAPMIAAGRVAEDAITQAIYAASEAKPKERPITKEQREAWETMKHVFDDEFFSLEFESIRGLAEAGVMAMQAEADKLMQHPTVKEAYDHFMFVAKLVYDETSPKEN